MMDRALPTLRRIGNAGRADRQDVDGASRPGSYEVMTARSVHLQSAPPKGGQIRVRQPRAGQSEAESHPRTEPYHHQRQRRRLKIEDGGLQVLFLQAAGADLAQGLWPARCRGTAGRHRPPRRGRRSAMPQDRLVGAGRRSDTARNTSPPVLRWSRRPTSVSGVDIAVPSARGLNSCLTRAISFTMRGLPAARERTPDGGWLRARRV